MIKKFIPFLLMALLLFGGCDTKDNGTSPDDGDGGNGGGNGNEIGGAVTLDHIDGDDGSGNVLTGVPITFYVRFHNNTGANLTGSTNGFRVYSPDGALWEPITWDIAYSGIDTLYDLGVFLNDFGVTGSGADTIGFGGANLFKPGIPDGFNEVVFQVTTQVESSYASRRICLDSCWYRPSNPWLWSTTGGIKTPTWDGPHCFQIVNP